MDFSKTYLRLADEALSEAERRYYLDRAEKAAHRASRPGDDDGDGRGVGGDGDAPYSYLP